LKHLATSRKKAIHHGVRNAKTRHMAKYQNNKRNDKMKKLLLVAVMAVTLNVQAETKCDQIG